MSSKRTRDPINLRKKKKRKLPVAPQPKQILFEDEDEERDLGETLKLDPEVKAKTVDLAKVRRRKRKKRKLERKKKKAKNAAAESGTRKNFFNGKTLAFTFRSGKVDDGDGSARDEMCWNRGELERIVKAAGGQVSPIVHQRVNIVVATAIAAKKRSQRVRKALKHAIPIVSPEFLMKCHEMQQLEPVDNFLLEVPNEETAPVVKSQTFPTETEVPIRVVDLGCCCSCHDDGKSSCDWCLSHHQ